VGTGVIGGFTTYSTFVLESERLLLGSTTDIVVGLAYLCVSIVAGLGAAVAGILVGGGPRGERRCGRHAGQDAGPAGAEASR
jgi:Integral membrane protein possibly involved in chromosome condensation